MDHFKKFTKHLDPLDTKVTFKCGQSGPEVGYGQLMSQITEFYTKLVTLFGTPTFNKNYYNEEMLVFERKPVKIIMRPLCVYHGWNQLQKTAYISIEFKFKKHKGGWVNLESVDQKYRSELTTYFKTNWHLRGLAKSPLENAPIENIEELLSKMPEGLPVDINNPSRTIKKKDITLYEFAGIDDTFTQIVANNKSARVYWNSILQSVLVQGVYGITPKGKLSVDTVAANGEDAWFRIEAYAIRSRNWWGGVDSKKVVFITNGTKWAPITNSHAPRLNNRTTQKDVDLTRMTKTDQRLIEGAIKAYCIKLYEDTKS